MLWPLLSPQLIKSLKKAFEPVLTDVRIDWYLPENMEAFLSPNEIPPLYPGNRLIGYCTLYDMTSFKAKKTEVRYTSLHSCRHNSLNVYLLYFDFTSASLVFCLVLVTWNNFGLHNLITLFLCYSLKDGAIKVYTVAPLVQCLANRTMSSHLLPPPSWCLWWRVQMAPTWRRRWGRFPGRSPPSSPVPKTQTLAPAQVGCSSLTTLHPKSKTERLTPQWLTFSFHPL